MSTLMSFRQVPDNISVHLVHVIPLWDCMCREGAAAKGRRWKIFATSDVDGCRSLTWRSIVLGRAARPSLLGNSVAGLGAGYQIG
jgi:hypothetical protein